MNYLRKKLQAIMASADFKGYLREVTGTDSVTLTDCMGSDMTSLSLVGNAIQDGTPSPDNPVEIQGCGDRTANLLDISYFASTSAGYVENGEVYVTGYPYQPRITPEEFLAITGLQEGDTFTTYGDLQILGTGTNSLNIQFTTKNAGLNYVVLMEYGKSNTSTIPVGFNSTNYNTLYIYAGGGDGLRGIWRNLMVVKGAPDERPPYEPYGYKIPVEVSGINLFDVSQITGTSGGYVQDGAIYVTGYPYVTVFTPEKFLAMTGLKEGDTFTTAADYEQVLQPPNPTLPGAQWIAFIKKPSAPADLSDVQFGTKGALKTTTIPEGFNSDNYNRMYIYGGSGTPETGQVRAIYRSLRVYKGTYTAETIPPYEPYHAPQTFNVYMDKPLYGLKLATGATGYYTYQDDNGNKYLCDTIAIDFDKHTAKRTDNLKYRSLADVAGWSEYTYILYDDVYSMFTINGANPGQDIKTYYTDTDGTNKSWMVDSIVSNAMPTDSTYPVNTTPSVCTGSTPSNFANCIRYWFLKTDVDAYTGDTVKYRVAAYWEDFCADRDVMALYITNPATTDISAMQDWDTIPKLWRGTAIATVKTTVPTKAITAQYYAAKKED